MSFSKQTFLSPLDTDYSQGYQYSQPAQPGANNSYSGYNYGQTGYAGYDPYSSKILLKKICN